MKSGTLLATWVFLALSAVAALGQVRGEAADAVLAADVVRRQGQVFDDVEKTGGRFLEGAVRHVQFRSTGAFPLASQWA
jgi:hypothetical protein